MQDTCSTSSAKLLLKKWMIRTVLLSNSWLVNYRQPKKNNIGKVLCVSWAVEICFYNPRRSRTCTWMSVAYSQPQIIFPQWNTQILIETQWKSNSSCSMKNNKLLPGIQGKEKKGFFLYTIYSKHGCSRVSVHIAIAYKQFCKQVDKLSFLRLRKPNSSRAEICSFLNVFWKPPEPSGMVLQLYSQAKIEKTSQISSTSRQLLNVLFSLLGNMLMTSITQYCSIFLQQ